MTLTLDDASVDGLTLAEQVEQLTTSLYAERANVALLAEDFTSAEMRADDLGWRRLSIEMERSFTREGLARIISNCRLMAVASPLVKRGLLLRRIYIWGHGCTIEARASSDDEQDVNAVVQGFVDDEANQRALFGAQAREEGEQTLGTDGNLMVALFTAPMTGRVQVRTTPFDEIRDKISNPDDRDETWFYLREYTQAVVEPGSILNTTRTRVETRRVYHPAVGYWPVMRPRAINGLPVLWDAPILHVAVNRLDGMKWGIPDAYAAVPWARAYEDFLTDWAKLMKSLSRIAWRLSGSKSDQVRRAAAQVQRAVSGASAQPHIGEIPGQAGMAGGMFAAGADVGLEAIPKTGATIDADSGKPLAALAAAAMGVPVTMLLADPGVTGARAVAQTLDTPTVLEPGMRRDLWGAAYQTIFAYVVAQSVKAPRGALRGTVIRDEWGREQVTLAGDVESTVDVTWPALDSMTPAELVTAIVEADSTGRFPPEQTLRLLLSALRVSDVDEVIQEVKDEHGGDIPDWHATAGAAAVDAFHRGEDPASTLGA